MRLEPGGNLVWCQIELQVDFDNPTAVSLRLCKGLFSAHESYTAQNSMALFFAAIHPRGTDIEELFGPKEPSDDGHAYVRAVVIRISKNFAEVIPLALRLMTHPSFDPSSLARA
jgi:hypothetical protein